MNGERGAKGLRPFPPRPFGRYTLLAPLAMGGMGEIFLGRMEGAQGFEKWVVIKRILPQLAQEQDFVDRFVTEAKILVKLHHGSVGQVLDMGQIDGDYYIALEFVDGKDLRKVASRCKDRKYPLPQGLALYVMGRVVDALAYAHRKKGDDDQALNLVHRDVSPQNILVSYEGEVKVIDFGLAKSSLASGRTNPSVILGKFFYMSPEQAQHGTVDRRSDLYAAGIVLYELLAGSNPFDGVPQAEIITRVAHPRIEPLGARVPGLSPVLDAVVMKALAPDPKERFASAEEMRGRLMAAMLEIDPMAGPESMAQFMRAVFAGEYAQERKVFASLREAASGGGAGIAATVTRPKVDLPSESGAKPSVRPLSSEDSTGGGLKNPSMAKTTTVDALPVAPEEFSFPLGSAAPVAHRTTDPDRPMIALPDLAEGRASAPTDAAAGHTVPFAAVSNLPASLLPPGRASAPTAADPQEWLAPSTSPGRPAVVVEEGHTTPFAALASEPVLPFPTVTAENPVPAGSGTSGPSPVPAWDLPPSAATLPPGGVILPPPPAPSAPGPGVAAPLSAAPLSTSRPPVRSPVAKVSSPRIPAAPKVAPPASAAPKVVIAQDLMDPEPPGSRPTIQVAAIEAPADAGPTKSGVEHLTTSPVMAAAPAGPAPAPVAPAAKRPLEKTQPASGGPPTPAPPGKPPSVPPVPAPAVSGKPMLSSVTTGPPKPGAPGATSSPRTERTPMSTARASLFVILGAGLGLLILGIVAVVVNHLR